MPVLRSIRAFFKLLFRRDEVEAELDAEIQAFYQTIVDRYMERGLSEADAQRLARLKFSAQEQVKEAVRDARAGATVSSIARDLKYAWRRMRNAPVFALVTIVTLALGIGANATIFSIVSRFVLRPPPVGNPSTLMALHTTHHGERCCNNFSWPLFVDVREQAKSFSGVAGYYELVPASVGGKGEPERVWGQAATANFFDVAQVGMTPAVASRETRIIVPLSFSATGFGGRVSGADPAIAGKTITLSGGPFTVVGVAPPSFRGVDIILDCQFWVPFANIDQLLPKTSNYESRFYHWVTVIGRLRPGVTRAQTAAELSVLAQRLAKAHPETENGGGFRFEPAGSLPPRDKSAVDDVFGALTLVALLRPMHCLRERCQPVPGTGLGPTARDGGAPCSGRHAPSSARPDAHRKRAAGTRRRPVGSGSFALGHAWLWLRSGFRHPCLSTLLSMSTGESCSIL